MRLPCCLCVHFCVCIRLYTPPNLGGGAFEAYGITLLSGSPLIFWFPMLFVTYQIKIRRLALPRTFCLVMLHVPVLYSGCVRNSVRTLDILIAVIREHCSVIPRKFLDATPIRS
jgi:hypothetical protein